MGKKPSKKNRTPVKPELDRLSANTKSLKDQLGKKPLLLDPTSATLKPLEDHLGPTKDQDSALDGWLDRVSSCLLPALIEISKHDDRPVIPAPPPSWWPRLPISSETLSPAIWKLALSRRIQIRSLASLVPREDGAIHEKMAELDKLLRFELLLSIAMDFKRKEPQQEDQSVHWWEDIPLDMLQEPLDPDLSPQHEAVAFAQKLLNRDTSKHIHYPTSLETRLDRSIRAGILARPNFAEHYYMAHMCVIAVLSRKRANLEAKENDQSVAPHGTFKGWNFNLQSEEMDLPVGCEPLEARQDVLQDHSTCPQERNISCSGHTTMGKISEIEDKLIRRIAKLEAVRLAAMETTYGCIRNLYRGS